MRSVLLAAPAALLLSLVALPQLRSLAEPATVGPAKLSHRDRLYDVAHRAGSHFVVGHPGLLLRSRNGGASFEGVSGGQSDEALFSIAFNQKGQGAVVGRSGFALTTEDGGDHWQKTLVRLGDEQPSLFAVAVLEDGTIVAVGEFGLIARSEDHGKTWSRSPYDATLPETPAEQLPADCAEQGADNENSDMIGEARLTGVDFLDNEHGLISGEFGLVLESTDGGRSFKRQNTCTDRTLYAIDMVDAKHSVAVGADGTVLETSDGGRVWSSLETGTIEHLFGVSASSSRLVVAGAAGTVLTRSADKPLRRVPTSVHSWLVSADLDEQGVGLIVGGRATVLKTSDGGNTQKRILGE